LVQDNQNIYNLLKGCLQNDRDSQKGLYQLLRKQAFAICYRYLDNEKLIEELLTKSFIQLFKHIDLFNKNEYPDIHTGLTFWFRSILVANCIGYYRQLDLFSHGQEMTLDIDYPPHGSENEAGQPSDQDIIEAIRKLPPSFKIVFNLSVIEGMSHKEIGGHFDISASRSGSILSAARKMIRKNLSARTTQRWAGEGSIRAF
jgi:RNA polymerase sigma factor (sigma-70 family)